MGGLGCWGGDRWRSAYQDLGFGSGLLKHGSMGPSGRDPSKKENVWARGQPHFEKLPSMGDACVL